MTKSGIVTRGDGCIYSGSATPLFEGDKAQNSLILGNPTYTHMSNLALWLLDTNK